MKNKIIILAFLLTVKTFSLEEQLFINSIDRIVWQNDTVYSKLNFLKPFKEESTSMWQDILIEELVIILSNYDLNDYDSTGNFQKRIMYKLTLSNNNYIVINSDFFIQTIDNMILFDYGYKGDTTFYTEWWFDPEKHEIIVTPSH